MKYTVLLLLAIGAQAIQLREDPEPLPEGEATETAPVAKPKPAADESPLDAITKDENKDILAPEDEKAEKTKKLKAEAEAKESGGAG